LIRQFLHSSECLVEPFELEYPPNDHAIAVNEDGTDAFRPHRLCPGENLAFVGNVQRASDARLTLIFLHRRVLRIELLQRVGMRVLLDSGDEALEGFATWHEHPHLSFRSARLSLFAATLASNCALLMTKRS